MNRFATLMIFKNNCSPVVVNIFKSVRAVSKADTRCINSEQCIPGRVFVQLEKQQVMFWHTFVLYNIRKRKNGFRKM
jgi:hypothetical protein